MNVGVTVRGIVRRQSADRQSRTPDLNEADLELIDKVKQLADGINAAAALSGLNRTDHQALAFIVRSEGLTAGQLAERVGLSTAAVTGVLNRLERSGHAVRAGAEDRRLVVVRATDKGRQEVTATLTALQAEIGRILTCYSDYELRTMIGLMALAAPAVVKGAKLLQAPRAVPPKIVPT